MNFVKQHKFTVFIIFLFILAVVVLFFVFNLFFSNSKKPEYGDRLDGIEEVEITTDNLNKIEDTLKKNNKVKKVNSNITGRTLDVVITVDDGISVSDAKKIGDESFSSLKENQIKYYSIQVFIKKTDSSKNNFPIIGYKQRNTTKLVWTKDRAVTKTDESK